MPSQHDEGTVYVTQRGREDDDFGAYVYKSTDYGKTFTSIAANIPAGSVNVIREDPTTASRLYVGTDFGAFVSNDGGKQWEVLGGNLPSVAGVGPAVSAARPRHRDLDVRARHVGDGRGGDQVEQPRLTLGRPFAPLGNEGVLFAGSSDPT